ILDVAVFAASAELAPPFAAITLTPWFTNSPAKVGRSSYCPRAQRYSIATFRPSVYPTCPSPCLNAARYGTQVSDEAMLRNPIRGNTDCCARAAGGQATAPPRPAINSRRLICSPQVSKLDRRE